MKVTMSNFNFIRNPEDKKRIIPEKGEIKSSGIKTYGKIVGWFRSHLGSAVELKDNRCVWYVKKEDLLSWAESQGFTPGFDLKQLNQFLMDLKRPTVIKEEQKLKPETPVNSPQRIMSGAQEVLPPKNAPKTYWNKLQEASKNLEKANQEYKDTEIDSLKLVISDLKNNPNKTNNEKQQLKDFQRRLEEIGVEKVHKLDDYIKNLKIESQQEIGPIVKEWVGKYQSIAKIYDLELSEEKELQLVNNTIAQFSKLKDLNSTLPFALLKLTHGLLEKGLKGK